MSYDVVFDAASSRAVWLSPMMWAGPALAVLALGLHGLRLKLGMPGRPGAMPYRLVAFFLLFTLAVAAMLFFKQRGLIEAERQGRATTVEGLVTNFKPMPYAGHGMERFCVAANCFQYSDFVLTAGFNNTSSHGGPIHEGLPVRVTFVGDTIVRLEVAAQ